MEHLIAAVFRKIRSWLPGHSLVCPSWRECSQVLSWAEGQLATGSERELALPPAMAGLSRQGVVQARRDKGRTCVLLKGSIGWKGNFTGTLCCNAPLRAGEIVAAAPPYAAFISLQGERDFGELYIRERMSGGCYRVYFDLN